MDWSERVAKVTHHVRAHLAGDLSVPALARVAHSSPFHFGRLFKAHTGETTHRFVRRARLERAAQLMRLRPDWELGRISAEVGLGSSSQFSRIFKGAYGIAPSRWDRRRRLSAFEPIAGMADMADVLAAARNAAPPFEVAVHARPEMMLAYVRVATPFMDNDLLAAGYARLTEGLTRAGVPWRERTLVGMSWDNPDTTPLEQVRFDLGFCVDRPVSGLGQHVLPAARWASVRATGNKAQIALAWEVLYDEWFPGSCEEPADLPAAKFFRSRPDALGWHDYDLDCAIALASGGSLAR